MNILESLGVLAVQNPIPRAAGLQGLILGTVGAVSILIISVGILYVLLKLGRFLDALKDKT